MLLSDVKVRLQFERECDCCGRQLPRGAIQFCGIFCRDVWREALGRTPGAAADYDFGWYDPEDDLYGDYEEAGDGLSEFSPDDEKKARGGEIAVGQPDEEDTDDDDLGDLVLANARAQSSEPVPSSESLTRASATAHVAQPEADLRPWPAPVDTHPFSSSGICTLCGRSRDAVVHFGWRCPSRPSVSAAATSPVSSTPPNVEAPPLTVPSSVELESEVRRLRAILQRMIGRYDREGGCRSDPQGAVLLAWVMRSDAREGLEDSPLKLS